MANWWTEMWTFGSGITRVYCGVARTEDGFAVDLFCGDVCLESWVYRSREAAVKAALELERKHSGRLPTEPLALPFKASRRARPRLVTH